VVREQGIVFIASGCSSAVIECLPSYTRVDGAEVKRGKFDGKLSLEAGLVPIEHGSLCSNHSNGTTFGVR
jgi:hypothetical protein